MRTIRYRRILLSTAAALSAMCCVQAVPTEVLFCFDTEDYTSDVFQGVVRFLRGEKSFLPDRAYGFLAPPKGIGMPMRVFAHDLREAAEKIDFSGYLPSEIDVGSVKIGPADFLFAVLEVLDSGAEEVVVVPRPQLGSFDGIAKLETLKVAGTDKWIIHSPDFKDDYLSDRLRLQLWTLRYE